MRLPEVTQNAGGGPLWGEDALGNGWFIPLTRRISAVCHVSERRRRDQGGGTRYLTCRPKPSGNNSKWPWRPEDHTN